MIPRIISAKLKRLSQKFPVIALIGPRQSGKTTLAQSVFPDKPYVSFEDLDTREFALQDPRGFLNKYSKGAVLDEIQRVPHIFSYLQTFVDQSQKSGMFILTGSQQFLLLESISQTLAGRVNILKLLPFSMEELNQAHIRVQSLEDVLFKGMYPRIYDRNIDPVDWYPAYIQTYVERDVRSIKNVGDLNTFQRFIRMCAARTGQLLNLSSLAIDCGITHNTAKAWISVLETSFIVYLLQPHHQNFNKRLIKMPKIYFYDTGLAVSLLGIENKNQLETHPLRGNLFETFVMSELMKQRLNLGLPPSLYFWRDKTGHEVDCIFDKGTRLIPIEIKSGKTITEDFFKNLAYWKKISKKSIPKPIVIYGGGETQERTHIMVYSWKALPSIFAS